MPAYEQFLCNYIGLRAATQITSRGSSIIIPEVTPASHKMDPEQCRLSEKMPVQKNTQQIFVFGKSLGGP